MEESPAVDADESLICIFLKLHPGQFVSGAEICRRAATRKRYREDAVWALPVLKRLVEKKVIESDSMGHYRLIPPQQKGSKYRKWISPQIRRILEQSGKTFEVVSPEEDSGKVDQHYD